MLIVLGDGVRYNIADVEPAERALLRDAFIELHRRFYPGARTDDPPGGVSQWFKQDEIHQATHVHHEDEFLPWHRELVNRIEQLLRTVDPRLSLHYWDWNQDPRDPRGDGSLNLFNANFMGSAGVAADEPWLSAGFYDPAADPFRGDSAFDLVNNNPADPPRSLTRNVGGSNANADGTPNLAASDDDIVNAATYQDMWDLLEDVHDDMHGYIGGTIGDRHTSFRDPFVFLLHSNVDRLFTRWQTDPAHLERLDPDLIYGALSGSAGLNSNVEPWSTGHGRFHDIRPWSPPENAGSPHTYKHKSIVAPPCYDTNFTHVPIVEVLNAGDPPVINFNDVPEDETTTRAAVFRIYGCSDATIRVKAGSEPSPPFSTLSPASGSITVAYEPRPFVDVRIWIAYTAGAAGVPVPDGAVTFECPESGQEFPLVVKANSIPRPSAAIVLALDQSGSMDDPAGSLGATRLQVLKEAATRFMQLVPPNSGVGLVRFDHDAYPVDHATYPGLAVRRITTDDDLDPDRVAAINAVGAHATNPLGFTSVGDGLLAARATLNAVPVSEDYDHKAIIAFTDGIENREQYISDVMGSIDSRTFAIGLGTETQVNTNALKAVTSGTEGYLLLTGLLGTTVDDYFLLTKYFHQILAGVTNMDIIVDPSGFIAPGTTVEIPFQLTEADIEATAIVLMDVPVIDMALRTPAGDIIDSANASGLGIKYSIGANLKHYRFTLPVALGTGAHVGTWTAILEVGDGDRGPDFEHLEATRLSDAHNNMALARLRTHGARYSFIADAYSNMRLRAAVVQHSLEPGAAMMFRALLSEYGLPVDRRARVSVEVTRPDKTPSLLQLPEVEPGVFQAEMPADLAGTYYSKFVAQGASMGGAAFTREIRHTSAVYTGGDSPLPSSTGDGELAAFLKACCRRLKWLLGGGVLLLLVILILLLLK